MGGFFAVAQPRWSSGEHSLCVQKGEAELNNIQNEDHCSATMSVGC